MTATAPGPSRSDTVAGDLRAALARELDGEVAFDAYTRHLFSTDASMYAIEPLGVVTPRHADDVVAAVAVAARFGVPVLPRGAGTSHCGQTVGAAVVLDLSRHLDGIVELDPEQRTARVQPGVVQDQLNRAAGAHGLMFAPDTSTANRATIGGMIGNNSCGSRSARYGMTVDHVQGLEVVLSDATSARFEPVDDAEVARRAAAPTLEGRLYRYLPRLVETHRHAIETGFPPMWRRAGGYRLDRLADADPFDLATLVVGSEGTLVTVTEATVGLVPVPRHTVGLVGHFHSTAEAIAATESAMAAGAAAVELVDRFILDLSRRSPEHAHLADVLEGDPSALLVVEFHADEAAEATAAADALQRRWRGEGYGYAVLQVDTPSQQRQIRELRKAGLGLLMASGVGRERSLAFVEDTAVDPRHLAEYTERFRDILDAHGLRAGFYGHASAGCLHVRPFMDLTAPGEIAKMHAVATEVAELVASYGGVNSSEHGDGLARSEFNRTLFGDELYEAMRQVKSTFDPDGRMNPGKVVDAPPMTEHLREPALPTPTPLPTMFDFGGPTGMFDHANRCMRIGACRKTTGGTMCPSYRATRQEEHSTRGRANALVKALSDPAGAAALGDERLHEILDLCLECKACKAECPLSVDMATMKSEFLHAYHARHGVPLRSRLFARIRGLNRLGSATAPVSNWSTRSDLARRVLERLVGIDRRRPLPSFAAATLPRWFARRPRPDGPAPKGDVVVLADSFTSFTEPGIGRAGVRLLERAGYRVQLESGGCCGRAAISKGLLDEARASAADLVARLRPAAEAGVPIVGLEPSCLLTLRDEHPDLLGDAATSAVAAQARLIEDLLVEAIDDGSLVVPSGGSPARRRILFHGHCHQKASVGTASTVALLERIPGAEVAVLDAGCCGMAGSFGFETEHYELSMDIGAAQLFPAVEAEDDATLVAATGVSCRQQIGHGTGRTAHHPIELLEQVLDGSGPRPAAPARR
jgi:FAD/FMN-containing dehydrogenase/Fe-S oxidoreductase